MKQTASTPPNFDRIARLYRWAEYLGYGPLLQRVRTRLLGNVLASRKALVLGDGDGRFLAEFLARNARAEVLAVDTSATMLHLLRTRCDALGAGARARLHTVQASALQIAASQRAAPWGADLVVSHFFLDCLSAADLRELVARLAAALERDALWLVSDFDVPRSAFLRPFARVYFGALYAGFRLLTGLQVSRLPPVTATLQHAGFVRLRRCEFAAGMLYTELWQLRAEQAQQTAQPDGPPAHPPLGSERLT